MTELIKPFRIRLKEALEYREMRAVDLCKKTGISQSTMSQYISGYAEPKKERLNLIATALNVNLTWLMGLNVPIEPENSKARYPKDEEDACISETNISFYEKIQLATHIERRIAGLNINNKEIEEAVYEDIGKQLRREFGLSRKHPDLDKKYLYEAHELIDCYAVPLYLQELINDANAQLSLTV